MTKTIYCPKCGSTDIQVEGARGEGRFAHCLDCGWGHFSNRVRYVIPKRAKPPCEHLVLDSRHSIESGWSIFYCALEICVNPESGKKVSCSVSTRSKYGVDDNE